MQIRDAQEYVQILEEQLHDQPKVAIMPSPRKPPAALIAPPNPPPGTAPASPVHGTVVYSTTVNVPSSQSGNGNKTCQCSSVPRAAASASFDASVAGEHHIHNSTQGVSCGATFGCCTTGCMPSTTCPHSAACPASAACAYRHPHCAQGQAARVPFADAANIPSSQHGAVCMQLPNSGYWNHHSAGWSSHKLPEPGYGTHGSEIHGSRYQSASLMRMQRLQDRLKASERDLSYRLGRLLGRDADEACYSRHT